MKIVEKVSKESSMQKRTSKVIAKLPALPGTRVSRQHFSGTCGQDVRAPRRFAITSSVYLLLPVCFLMLALCAPTGMAQDAKPLRSPDVIYVPTPQKVVESMLRMANVTAGDIVYDLGSGDGRIPITAIRQFNAARAIGIDIDPKRIQEANDNAKEAGVTDRVKFLNQDLFTTDFSEATVITLYLLSSLNEKLRPQLLQLKPGTRIVSHAFSMGDWVPEKTETIDGSIIYFWTVPPR